MSSPWVATYSGGGIHPLNPHLEDIRLEDIAQALSLKCRYNGHVSRFYSVASHSLWVARYLAGYGPVVHLQGLLHDAAEAYLPDVVVPLRPIVAINGVSLEEAEKKLLAAIFDRFNVPWPIAGEVWLADKAALVVETEALGIDTLRWGQWLPDIKPSLPPVWGEPESIAGEFFEEMMRLIKEVSTARVQQQKASFMRRRHEPFRPGIKSIFKEVQDARS